MLLMIELAGAIGLLLFGLRQVRNGMIRAFGTTLKRLASRTDGRIKTWQSPIIKPVQIDLASLLIRTAPKLVRDNGTC